VQQTHQMNGCVIGMDARQGHPVVARYLPRYCWNRAVRQLTAARMC
jgi:hypothetical protein